MTRGSYLGDLQGPSLTWSDIQKLGQLNRNQK